MQLQPGAFENPQDVSDGSLATAETEQHVPIGAAHCARCSRRTHVRGHDSLNPHQSRVSRHGTSARVENRDRALVAPVVQALEQIDLCPRQGFPRKSPRLRSRSGRRPVHSASRSFAASTAAGRVEQHAAISRCRGEDALQELAVTAADVDVSGAGEHTPSALPQQQDA